MSNKLDFFDKIVFATKEQMTTGKFWESMGGYGKVWECMGMYGNVWEYCRQLVRYCAWAAYAAILRIRPASLHYAVASGRQDSWRLWWEVLGRFGKVWEFLGALPPITATLCVAAKRRKTAAALCVCGRALPGVSLAGAERQPAVAGFARFPYPLIHSHTLP